MIPKTDINIQTNPSQGDSISKRTENDSFEQKQQPQPEQRQPQTPKMKFSHLFLEPEINPRTKKALSIPFLNLKSKYARCFHLSWLGFFVSFLSWFAFPPLLSHTIKLDLNLTPQDISNNNICGLAATLVARVILGPLCDRFGPRWVMVLVLVTGAVPTAFAACVTNVAGLHLIRFFIGLLGGSFVPCQVWTTTFFDKSIVGTANALAGGWGNAGGGVAFFIMPALVSDLLARGYSPHRSWGLSFVIGPMIILLFVALLIAVFGDDCPEGRWSQRKDVLGLGVDVTETEILSLELFKQLSTTQSVQKHHSKTEKEESESSEGPIVPLRTHVSDLVSLDQIVEDPKLLDVVTVGLHWRTMLVSLGYVSTFGGELAIEAVMSAVYLKHSNFTFSQQLAGNWASMLGLLNIFTRPTGGIVSDLLYRRFKTTKAKKFWMVFCGFMEGVFLLWIGFREDMSMAGLIVAMTFMDIFMEMGNGANFSLVPHINPHHTGIVAGMTGAFGNLGGIFFSLVFRFQVENGVTQYFKGFWIIGIVMVVLNFLISWIPVKEDRPEGYIDKTQQGVV